MKSKQQNNFKKKLKKYFMAGVDFLIDTEGKVVFIEANSYPGLFRALEQKYGFCKPINEMKKTFTNENHFLFIETQKTYDTDSKYKYKKFKEFFGSDKVKKEIIKDLKKETIENLKDKILKLNYCPIIYTPFVKLKKILLDNNYHYILNPYPITKLTINKSTLYSKIKSTKNFKVPNSYSFKTKSALLKIIKENKLNKIVIKPQNGQRGKDLYIINDLKELKKIRLKKQDWIVQEKIEINKINNNFWDIRSYVINNNFCGMIGRKSKNPAVNVSLGGKTFKIPNDLEEKIKKASEDVVRQINKML